MNESSPLLRASRRDARARRILTGSSIWTLVAFVATLAVPLGAAAAPKKKEKTAEKSWVHPDFASFGVDRIAMLPVTAFNNDLIAEKKVEGAVSYSLSETGFRWISAGTSREMLRSAAPNDSLLKLVKESILKQTRIDSTLVPRICAKLRCQALLAVRIDQWEQRQLEAHETGKPSTSVQLKGALIDSSGALLWSSSAAETAEGPYHEPIAATSGMQRQAMGAEGGAPDYVEVVNKIGVRWAASFPAKAVAAPAAPADTAGAVPIK